MAFDACSAQDHHLDDGLAGLHRDAKALRKELVDVGGIADAELYDKHGTDLLDGTTRALSPRARALFAKAMARRLAVARTTCSPASPRSTASSHC